MPSKPVTEPVSKYEPRLKYCPECGKPIIVKRREPNFDTNTGELKGFYIDLVCSSWINRTFKHPFIWWDYETVNVNLGYMKLL